MLLAKSYNLTKDIFSKLIRISGNVFAKKIPNNELFRDFSNFINCKTPLKKIPSNDVSVRVLCDVRGESIKVNLQHRRFLNIF